MLQLKPVWLSDQGKISELSQGLRYSWAEEKWDAFAQIEPQLRVKIQECQSSQWAQSTNEQRFSLVVEEYCDSVELQFDSSESEEGLPTPADVVKTANSNRPLDPSQGRDANTTATDTFWDDDWVDDDWRSILNPNYFDDPLSTGQSHLLGFNSTMQDH